MVATGNVHYARPADRPLATALAAVRSVRALPELEGWLPAGPGAHLRSPGEQKKRFARYPGVLEAAAEVAEECAFDLSLVAPGLPPFPCPEGHDENSYLRLLVERGATARYGPRTAERVPGAWAQIDHELQVICDLGYAGYFLIVWDIVEFCRRKGILCQGRGSAANSAVCYSLGITIADPVSLGLLFERFLSPARDGPPDIDVDIQSDRREEVISYVYERYGRANAALVCNVITYRARSAIRDAARALGYQPAQVDGWLRGSDRWAPVEDHDRVPPQVRRLAARMEGLPRHLGIHPGGMVICDRPIAEVCPVEWATMEGRSVLQWDKDDCAAVGLVKFDLLGLGMLSAIAKTVELVRRHEGVEIDLAALPQEDAVYEMLSRGDSVGVFQVESRAQMSTLPRMRPRRFYDLVVEVGLIRPGPIQGGSVHPYLRRRSGREPVTYPHPLAEKALAKTLGVPLFQEQLMQLAVDVAGFSPTDADMLRQAMASKRSRERMERLRDRFMRGAAARGVPESAAEEIWSKIVAFADYGFPESHAVSFAALVYASAWLKLHHPAAFYAALLASQPMGFWSPHTLTRDARRHGVVVLGPCVNSSQAETDLEEHPSSTGGFAVRLGLGEVRHCSVEIAARIVQERERHGPYRDMEDLRRRTGVTRDVLESLATAGAFTSTSGSPTRREALWAAGAVSQTGPDRLRGVVTGARAPRLPEMTDWETSQADLWATGMAPDGHPTVFVREELDALGVVTAERLAEIPDRQRVWVAGVVTHRQRPATAGGTTFISLEDETGLVNVICSQGCWKRHAQVAAAAAALLVRGRVEHGDGAVNVVAERLAPLPLGELHLPARDFR
ncbi:MAG: error-prone DNA polymerase [Acidimicrobiales bacterium]|nr:MAG: error-prone DNA polymerase [Acidimicrobiales bacterium]